MPAVSRRSFLERLSLGAGAFFLSPMASSLLNEARGAVPTARRFLLVVSGNGWTPPFSPTNVGPPTYALENTGFVPPELRDGPLSKKGIAFGSMYAGQPSDFSLTPSMAALAPHRSRMLLVDGLTNRQWVASGGLGSGHSQGFATLSCVPNPGMDHDGGGTPGGITFDQYLAGTLGKDSPFKSVNLATRAQGTDGSSTTRLLPTLCATGPGTPVQSYCLPREAFMRVFAGVRSGTSDPRADAIFAARRSVMDFVAADVQRLQARLAPTEKRKLDEALSSIRALEQRLTTRVDVSAACQPPMLADSPLIEDRQDAQLQIATAALLCGITRVAVVLFAAGPESNWEAHYVKLGANDRIHSIAHGDPPWGMNDTTRALVNKVHNFHAGLVAGAVSRLAEVREGDRTVLDDSVVMWMNDAGAFHHCNFARYPMVLFGNAGGALKVDGRYLRYPLQTGDDPVPGARSVADMFCTIATALGAPTNSFGSGGKVPVKGPLGSEILS
jgi:hypothetical protein